MVSRLLGLVREQVFAALLGDGRFADAFQIAFRIPNLLRDLFAEGALSAAFVPTYARTLVREGREPAFRLARRLFTLVAVLLLGIVLLGVVFAGPLVAALAPGFHLIPGKAEATVTLTRVMMPFLPLVSFAAARHGDAERRGEVRLPGLLPGDVQRGHDPVGPPARGAVGARRSRSHSAGPWARCSGEPRSS